MLLPEELDALPTTANDVCDYLSSSSGLRVPVSPYLFDKYLAANPDNADVATAFELASANPKAQVLLDGLIVLEKGDNLSELTTTVLVNRFVEDSFTAFRELQCPGLAMVVSLNKTETGTTSRAIELKKRPDTLIISNNCTLMVGEDKEKQNMSAAIDDLKSKLKGLHPGHYGPVKFLLAYTAAGLAVQFWSAFGAPGEPMQLQPATEELQLTTPWARAKMIITLAKVYRLLQRMDKDVPNLRDRLPLFQEVSRPEGCITFHGDTVLKRIERFKAYASKYNTSLEEVRLAYAAAGSAPRVNGEPIMVHATEGPVLSSRGTYSVTTKPVGYVSQPRNVEEVADAIRAVCMAVKLLHAQGIVHRDLRKENLVRLGPKSWMLIDYELAARDGKFVHNQPKGWDKDTLDREQRYTKESDMHQMGLLLKGMLQEAGVACGPDTPAHRFAQDLVQKQLTAQQALEHSWLQ